MENKNLAKPVYEFGVVYSGEFGRPHLPDDVLVAVALCKDLDNIDYGSPQEVRRWNWVNDDNEPIIYAFKIVDERYRKWNKAPAMLDFNRQPTFEIRALIEGQSACMVLDLVDGLQVYQLDSDGKSMFLVDTRTDTVLAMFKAVTTILNDNLSAGIEVRGW